MGQNPTEDELLALVMEVDINGDGTIDFDEFLGMMKQKAHEVDEDSDLKEAFRIFDRDRNGYIDRKELKKVSTSFTWNFEFCSDDPLAKVVSMLGTMLTKEEIDDFMREADVDGNGKLDYDEFVKMMLDN